MTEEVSAERLLAAYDTLGDILAHEEMRSSITRAAKLKREFRYECEDLSSVLQEVESFFRDRFKGIHASTPYWSERRRGSDVLCLLVFDGEHLMGGKNGGQQMRVNHLPLAQRIALCHELEILWVMLKAEEKVKST